MNDHQRANHDRSTDLANQIRRLVGAVYTVADNFSISPEQLAQTDTVFALLTIAEEKLDALEKAQAMEWVGLGGKSDNLNDAEIKLARGE